MKIVVHELIVDELLWFKQTYGLGLCFEDQYEATANFKEELPALREALINAGWVKNVGEGA